MKKQLNYDELATVCLERHGLGIDHPAVKEAGMREMMAGGKKLLSQGGAKLDDYTVALLRKLKVRFGGKAKASLHAVRDEVGFVDKAMKGKKGFDNRTFEGMNKFVDQAPEEVKKLHQLQAAIAGTGAAGATGGYMMGKESGFKEVVNTVDDVIIKALSKLKGKAGQMGTRLSRSSRAVANEGKFIDDATKGLVGLQQSDFRTLGGIAQNAGDDMNKLHALEAILGGAGIVGTGATAYGATR